MRRMSWTFALCALAVALAAERLQRSRRKAEPSTWDQTKEMTRKEWDAAKKKWAQQKVKWNDCNRQSRNEKLEAPKSWSFIASCMTKT